MDNLITNPDSFNTKRKFYDDKNYARGFARSGDFNLKEAAILEQYGAILTDLSQQKVAPQTDEESQFVKVCVEQLPPETLIEKTWVKYQNKILSPKHFHTLFGRAKVNADDSDDDEPIDENIDLD